MFLRCSLLDREYIDKMVVVNRKGDGELFSFSSRIVVVAELSLFRNRNSNDVVYDDTLWIVKLSCVRQEAN